MAAAAANPIEREAEAIRVEMVRYISETVALMNQNQVPELLIERNLFASIPTLVKTRFIQGDQPIAVSQKVSIAVKRIGHENRYDPQITNLLAVTLACIAGVRFELFNIIDTITEDIEIVLRPQPGDELPTSAAARTAQEVSTRANAGRDTLARGAVGAAAAPAQAAIAALANFSNAYLEQIGMIKDDMLGVIEDALTNLMANIRNLHMRIVLDPVIRSVQGRFLNEQQINEYLPRISTLITQILGHTFGQEGPFNIEDLRLINILGRTNQFVPNANNQSGILKFTGNPATPVELRADNIEDLKKYDTYTLEGINAYAYWKLMLYAPQSAWTEVKWMKNLTNRTDKTWWENPAIRFDLFINAWILDTLSRVGQLKSDQPFDEKMAFWKQLASLPAGAPNKIAISDALLNEISLFDAFFKIDYQSLFPRSTAPNVRMNPFNYLFDEGIRREFVTQHFIESIMIDCAKQALCAHVREAAIVRQNGLRSYNGIGVGNPIVADKRVDLRGLRYFLDFVDTKILSPRLERSSAPYFQLTIVMGTFMNYVSVYAFHNGVAPGNQNAWTADRSPTLVGAGPRARGGARPNYPSLLAYLNELRQRVENQEPLCETTPNIYLDIPVLEDTVPSARPAASSAPVVAASSASPAAPSAPLRLPVAAASPSAPLRLPVAAASPAPVAAASPAGRRVGWANQRDPALAAALQKSRSPSPSPLNAVSDPGGIGEPAVQVIPQPQRTGLRLSVNPAVQAERQALVKSQTAELARSRQRLSPEQFQALQQISDAALRRFDELHQV